MAEKQSPHVLLVTFPAQGHINPTLHFAKRLIRMGIEVTFATSVCAHRRISKAKGIIKGLNLAPYSDGYDDGYNNSAAYDALNHYLTEMKNRGSESLRDIIANIAEEGRPITSLVYTILIPWVADVAREFHIPCALLWIQQATVFGVYYHYFSGYADEITQNYKDPNWSIQLPGLPLLSARDLPSFLVDTSPMAHSFAALFKEQFEKLGDEQHPKILVNTFDALETEQLKSIQNYSLIGVGPLIPSALLDGKDPSDTSSGGDLLEKSENYTDWLNSQPESSVVYVSFGSISNPPKNQMEEIAKGLLKMRRPFLWVIRANENGEEEEKLSCFEELEKLGKIVPWCSQAEVLTHSSLGCFVTHCGWNSTLESLACGVPVVAFPQWSDQLTNAKLIQDVWRTGIRVATNGDGIIESDEIRRCIEMVMDGGEIGKEMRSTAKKWKELAREAMQEGGSSDKNLKSFVGEVRKCL